MTYLATVLVAAGSSAVLSLAYNTVVARQLGPIAYSEFATALAMATMFVYAGGALAPITAHLSARYAATGEPEKIRGLVAALLHKLLPLVILFAVAAAILAPPVARVMRFESTDSLLVGYGVFAGLVLLSVARSAGRGAQQFRRFGIGVFGECAIRLIAGSAMLVLWPHPVAALGGYLVGLTVTLAWTLRGLRALTPTVVQVPRSDVTSLLVPPRVLVVAMAAFQNIDLLLVRLFFRSEEAGIYAAAMSFARWMAFVAFPFEALLVPQLTYLGDRGHSVVAVAARLGAGFLALGAVPLALFATIPHSIVALLYGEQYQDAAPLLLALGLAVFAQYASYLAVQVLLSRAQTWAVVVFAAMGIVEIVIVMARHDSLQMVALVLVTVRMATLLAILMGVWTTNHRLRAFRGA